MTHFSRLTPRRQATVLSILRWVTVLVVGFILFIVGNSLYVNVINRAPAEVAVAYRDTAVASKYGTVTVSSVGVLTLFAQNAGFLKTPPDLANNTQAQGVIVKEGQLLGTITDENIVRQVRDAQTAYDAALARQKTGPPTKAPLEAAQDRLTRLQKLPRGNVAQSDLEAAQSTVAQYASAVENENLALRQAVDQTASILKAAQEVQSRTLIKAPWDGVLTAAFFLDNSYVLPNQAVFTVSQLGVNIIGQVNEEDVSSLKLQMKADVQLYSYGTKTFKATVLQILPSPDANSSRYTLVLTFDEPPPDDIKFGMTGQMNIIIGLHKNALLIPASAVIGSAVVGQDQVMIVDNGVVEIRNVKLGFKSMDLAQVDEGLNEGTLVIRADQDTFRPGDRVRPFKGNDVKKKTR